MLMKFKLASLVAPLQLLPQTQGTFRLGVGDVVHLLAAMFLHQRTVQHHALAVGETGLQLCRVALDDRLGDRQVVGAVGLAQRSLASPLIRPAESLLPKGRRRPGVTVPVDPSCPSCGPCV